MTNTALHKGEKAPLEHSLTARQRVVVGLSWDMRGNKVKLLDQITKHDSQHDLDITCYIYNQKREFIDFVGAEAQDSMDTSGKIYHSGDDMTGIGDGDDETIAAELANIPAEVHGFVFLVEIRSNHVFANIETPFTRLIDGMTDTALLEIPINQDDAANSNAFVMCSIYRNEKSPSGWTLYNISEHPDVTKIQEWGNYLAQFID